MHPWSYACVYVLVAIGVASLFTGGLSTFALPLIVFGLVPLCELFTPGTTANATPDQEQTRLADPRFNVLLLAAVPAVYGSVATLLWQAHTGALVGIELLGGVASIGLLVGALGLNVGHELGHRASKRMQMVSRVLYFPALYVHFFVEHNRGHHMRVATEEDPASARRGDWLYAHWVRSIVHGVRSAWDLEATRLRRTGHSPFSLRNEVLVGWVLQAVALGAVFAWSPVAAVTWVGAALVGVLLLETVNYVEHYGLRRSKNARGRWERVRPIHSWNSNHSIGRVLLFDLSRHSDHHANPRRPFPVLRHFDDAPQLPTGYPGMMVLSTVPPLFHLVMERELDRVSTPAPAAA